jgi:hypothetical protein
MCATHTYMEVSCCIEMGVAALWSAAEANAATRVRNEGFAGTPGFARTAEGDRAND